MEQEIWHFDFFDEPDGRRRVRLREWGITRSVRAPRGRHPALVARVFGLFHAFSPEDYARLQQAAAARGPVTVQVRVLPPEERPPGFQGPLLPPASAGAHEPPES